MPAQKPREIAVHILRRHAEKGRYLEALVDEELTTAQLSAVDRSLVQELTYGVVRWRATLDWLIQRKATEPPRKPALQSILRLGLYQLFWLTRVPDHAAVNESVDLARQFGFSGQTGFVNALLRDYLREREETIRLLQDLKQSQPALGYSHPDWLYQRWVSRWGADAAARLLDWNNRPAPTCARRNTLKVTAAQLEEAWKNERVQFTPLTFDWAEPGLAYEFKGESSILALHSFQQGFYYVQDPSTLLAVRELDPQAGESILDFCAAPGGKTTHIAERMQNKGYIMAQDLDIHRRNAIKENCTRLGITIVSISRATTTINLDLSEPFDRILADVPCSNTGVMRRRVDLRWRIQPEELTRLSEAQLEILSNASHQVKPKGILVYSTCSLEEEENGKVVSAFRASHPEFTLDKERQLLPWVDGVDGAYVAVLRRSG